MKHGPDIERYLHYFGLCADPFALTPDPAFLYMSPGHAEALAGLKLGLHERRGLIAMIGEVGTGKTTLLYSLLSGLGPDVLSAYIANTTLSFDGILRTALKDFGLPHHTADRSELLGYLNEFLLVSHTEGKTVTLIVDEAQNLSESTFEELRLLSNYETYKAKLLQIILVGQPELEAKLASPGLRQVNERIAVRCYINPLSRQDARGYIRHRLEAVGGSPVLFTPGAIRLAVAKSRGIPRRINILCHNALLFAYGKGEKRVTKRIMAAAAREREGRGLVRLKTRHRRGQYAGNPAPSAHNWRHSGLTWAVAGGAIGAAAAFVLASSGWWQHQVAGRFTEPPTFHSTSSQAMRTPTADQSPSAAPAFAGLDGRNPQHRRRADRRRSPHGGHAVDTASALPLEAANSTSLPSPASSTETAPPAPGQGSSRVNTTIGQDSTPDTTRIAESTEAHSPDQTASRVETSAGEKPLTGMMQQPQRGTAAASIKKLVESVSTEPSTVAAAVAATATFVGTEKTKAGTEAMEESSPAVPSPTVKEERRVENARGDSGNEVRPRHIKVPSGKTLSELTLAVYGRYDKNLVRKVQEVNPRIADPDEIYAGDTLLFPSLSRLAGSSQ